MTTPVVRTDRVGLLVEQLADAVELSRLRIDGITAAEFMWEPLPDMWSIRPRDSAGSPDAFGPGGHVLDADHHLDPFAGGPLTTIAWRVGHLVSGFAGRWEWTFGARTTPPEQLVDFVPDSSMLTQLWKEIERWIDAVDALDDDRLDQIGYGQYPYGLDAELPFIAIVRWMNRETVHHLSEIALLRDLYAARGEQRSSRPSTTDH